MAFETDPHRLAQRQKQIDFGLATTGYANYVSWLKTNKGRVKPIPIPNIYIKCSKRSWDGQIRHWRRLLHLWDAADLPTGTPEDRHFQDPCAGEIIEYCEVDLDTLPEPTVGLPPPRVPHRVESPTPLSSSSPNQRSLESPRFLKRSSSADFTPSYGAHHPHSHLHSHSVAQPQSFIPQMSPVHHHAPHMPHNMHLHSPAPYQIPTHMMPAPPPSAHPALGYMYPPIPPLGWQLSYIPTSYPAMPPPVYTPTAEPVVAAELVLVTEQEALARSHLWDAEAAELQGLLYRQYISALTAAAVAQKELTHQPPTGWNETSIGMLLNDEFGNGSTPAGQVNNELLPPSLAEPSHHTPGSPEAASDTQSLASFADLRLDEERYHNFRRHFGEVAVLHSGASLESPPPCWSPACLTPGVAARSGILSASPGLTASPTDWFASQRSPVQVSPRAALAFADWASPHPGKTPELVKTLSAATEAPSVWTTSPSS